VVTAEESFNELYVIMVPMHFALESVIVDKMFLIFCLFR